MTDQAQLSPRTLDLLKAVSVWPLQGHGALARIGGVILVERSALSSALFRPVCEGLLTARWGISENYCRAGSYDRTSTGRNSLLEETDGCNRLATAEAAVLAATSGEL